VAPESPATGCGAPHRGVAACGREANMPVSSTVDIQRVLSIYTQILFCVFTF
jgi:hypothetical protein